MHPHLSQATVGSSAVPWCHQGTHLGLGRQRATQRLHTCLEHPVPVGVLGTCNVRHGGAVHACDQVVARGHLHTAAARGMPRACKSRCKSKTCQFTQRLLPVSPLTTPSKPARPSRHTEIVQSAVVYGTRRPYLWRLPPHQQVRPQAQAQLRRRHSHRRGVRALQAAARDLEGHPIRY